MEIFEEHEFSRLPAKTPDELVGACRAAAALGDPYVYANRKVMEYFQRGSPEYKVYFSMMNVTVIEEGKLIEAEQDFNRTTEQVNHRKA